MKKILVLGSVAYDYIMDYPQTFAEHILPDKLHEIAVSFTVDRLSKSFGGNGGNTAYTLSLLGQSPTLLSSVGKDDFNAYGIHMKQNSIDTRYINKMSGEFTASAFIMTDKNNCQITGFYEGAGKYIKDITLPQDEIGQYELLTILPSTVAAQVRFIKEATGAIPYIFSPAQEIPQLTTEELLEGMLGAEILMVNDYEIALVMEKTGMNKKDILQKVPIVVTTLGKSGSTIETKGVTYTIGIVPATQVKDPTGAGDAYIAGFATGFIHKMTLQQCGQIGATAATYAIEQHGTQNHTFTLEQFYNRYEEAFGKKLEIPH